jgi:hypothetical protein
MYYGRNGAGDAHKALLTNNVGNRAVVLIKGEEQREMLKYMAKRGLKDKV